MRGQCSTSDRSSQSQIRTFGHGRPPAVSTIQRLTRSFLHREVAKLTAATLRSRTKYQCFWIQFVIRSRTLGENCISAHGFPGSDGCVHTHIQWSMSGIVATVKSLFAASPRYLTSGPRFVAASRSRSRAPWIARKGFVNARNASPGSVRACDRRSGAHFTH
jgi:hypothetical protein